MCAQLYVQRAAQPDTWVMSGAPAATTIWLSRDTPINYSDGTTDTLPANTPAVIVGSASNSFDRTHDVYVPLTVKGSGVLSIIKESLLPTLTDDYAPLSRVELHGIKPYQPEPYLAAGGLGGGGGTSTTVTALVSDTTALVLDLSPSTTPPALWYTSGFDDSAWVHAVAAYRGSPTVLGGVTVQQVWPTVGPTTTQQSALLRKVFTPPVGLVTSATLYVEFDAAGDVYLNGTLLGSDTSDPTTGPILTFDVTTALLAGAPNLLACHGTESAQIFGHNTWIAYMLSVTYAGSGTLLPAPAGPAEGDLLYYHSGQWVRLPASTNGYELTLVAGDPAWTAQPATGSVTSVALAGPTGTTVSGSPVTSSGTLTLSWASQSANVVLASPNGSSGAPTFRALVGADIPVDTSTIVSSAGTIKGNYQAGSGVSISGNTISATGSGGSVTSVALSLPGIFSLSGSPITTSGTLTVTLATQAAASVFAGPASGSAAAPTFRALQGTDLPAAAASGGHIHAWGHFH